MPGYSKNVYGNGSLGYNGIISVYPGQRLKTPWHRPPEATVEIFAAAAAATSSASAFAEMFVSLIVSPLLLFFPP